MHILLVDDADESRTSLAGFLRDLGHQVTECANGTEALSLFSPADHHLVLSDIRMPGLSGIDLLRAIRKEPANSGVDVILLTGYGNMDTAVEALRAGAYDYLLKPVNLTELVNTIERAAERRMLRQENAVLTSRFEEAVQEAARETRDELSRMQRASLQCVGTGSICCVSQVMRDILGQAGMLHNDRSIPVMIEGETGTGKEVLARYIHYGTEDVGTPFIGLNCTTLNPSNFESELFGFVPGAMGGTQGKRGKIDLAQGGTLFLDHVDQLPLSVQAKLLRVIEEKEFFRVGGLHKVGADIRVICATNINLKEQVEKGAFRSDLYYRLRGAYFYLPPLRHRREDIVPLAELFLTAAAAEKEKRFKRISKAAAGILQTYDWPGNVRELKNTIELIVLMWDDTELKPLHLNRLRQVDKNGKDEVHQPNLIDIEHFTLPPDELPLKELNNRIVLQALRMHNGNKTQTAKYLGISRRSLDCRLKHLL